MPLQDYHWSLRSSSQVTDQRHKEPKYSDYRKDKDAEIMHIWNSSYTAKSQTNNTLSTLLAYQCFFQLEHSNKTAEYRKVSLAMEKGSRTHPISDMHWENHHLDNKKKPQGWRHGSTPVIHRRKHETNIFGSNTGTVVGLSSHRTWEWPASNSNETDDEIALKIHSENPRRNCLLGSLTRAHRPKTMADRGLQ